MRRRGRTDANQAAIVEALRQVGWKVQSTASLGGGFPDLVIARGYDVRLVEVKAPKGRLTEDQQRFHQEQGWPVSVVRSVDDALNL